MGALNDLGPNQQGYVAAVAKWLNGNMLSEMAEVFDATSGSTEERLETVLAGLAAFQEPINDRLECRHCGRAIHQFRGVWMHSDVPESRPGLIPFTRGCKTVAQSFGVSYAESQKFDRKYAQPVVGQ